MFAALAVFIVSYILFIFLIFPSGMHGIVPASGAHRLAANPLPITLH